MKKLIFLLPLLFLAASVFGQASGTTKVFLPNEQVKTVTTTAGDTVGGTAVKYWIFALNKPSLQLWSYVIDIDTIKTRTRGAGNRVAIKNYGSLDGTTWVQVGSTIFYNRNAGTLADSTFAVSDVSTGVIWKYLKLEFTGIVANKCSKPTLITLRVAEKK